MRERWQQVGELFDRALSLPTTERDAFVRASGEPTDIQDEVLSLLASHDTTGSFLETDSVDVHPLAEGTLIGPYRVGPIIGTGGMGVVYQAEDTRLHRRVALKSLSPRFSREERQRQRLRHEARAAAALAHPGIATVYALEEFDGQLFIASEYLEGETLRAEIGRGPMDIPEAVASALEIARALCVAHERGIVHRDLKPENIVRTTSRVLKILDFGLAQFEQSARDLASVTRLTQPGLVAGTPSYMAPEQLLGRTTDFRTDQFAFGVIFCEMCIGRHPFGGQSLPSTIARILGGEPEPPRPHDRIPRSVWDVIEHCLQKEPGKRFASTRELVSAIEQLVGSPSQIAQSERLSGMTHNASALGTSYDATRRTLLWWRIHQFGAVVAYWAMIWPAWHVHGYLGRAGLFFFFATLAAVVVAGNLRLHLWFSSRIYPDELPAQRADVALWIRSADIVFATLLLIGGLALPPERAGWAALLISFSLGSAIAFLFIEPVTTRAAFRKLR